MRGIINTKATELLPIRMELKMMAKEVSCVTDCSSKLAERFQELSSCNFYMTKNDPEIHLFIDFISVRKGSRVVEYISK